MGVRVDRSYVCPATLICFTVCINSLSPDFKDSGDLNDGALFPNLHYTISLHNLVFQLSLGFPTDT
jgi:hypothetical protein